METHYCRVCGYYLENPPWGHDGRTPNYEICPCCGVEFGNEDYTVESTRKYRTKWLAEGASWFTQKERPEKWDIFEQIKNIPKQFL